MLLGRVLRGRTKRFTMSLETHMGTMAMKQRLRGRDQVMASFYCLWLM